MTIRHGHRQCHLHPLVPTLGALLAAAVLGQWLRCDACDHRQAAALVPFVIPGAPTAGPSRRWQQIEGLGALVGA